jgi:uncharacterized protein involved in response to NO
MALAAAVANLWRLSRWRGLAARHDALVLVLHLGFLFAALGFAGVGAHALWPDAVPYAVGVHVWAIGAVGTMTLAMMTRATLGHSGRALVASKRTKFAYVCVIVALIARVAMAMLPAFAMLDASRGLRLASGIRGVPCHLCAAIAAWPRAVGNDALRTIESRRPHS